MSEVEEANEKHRKSKGRWALGRQESWALKAGHNGCYQGPRGGTAGIGRAEEVAEAGVHWCVQYAQ